MMLGYESVSGYSWITSGSIGILPSGISIHHVPTSGRARMHDDDKHIGRFLPSSGPSCTVCKRSP